MNRSLYVIKLEHTSDNMKILRMDNTFKPVRALSAESFPKFFTKHEAEEYCENNQNVSMLSDTDFQAYVNKCQREVSNQLVELLN